MVEGGVTVGSDEGETESSNRLGMEFNNNLFSKLLYWFQGTAPANQENHDENELAPTTSHDSSSVAGVTVLFLA